VTASTNAEADLWSTWSGRWDRFQESYVPHREVQFEVIGDYLELRGSGEALRILDLCCGPGSVAGRLLQRFPSAEVLAVDCDPWLLALGRRTAPSAERITWIDADLREEAWIAALPSGDFDAVVVTTAMQWFTSDEIARIYHDIHGCLLPRGSFLNADVIPCGDSGTRRLSEAAYRGRRRRSVAAPNGEHWATFWAAARAEPAFGELVAHRDRRLHGRSPLRARDLEFHLAALRDAGFTDVGEVWREHDNAILLALRD
jgi:ubiquinone/menaquinone biosynthesis C-methylase UbiE